MPPTPRADLKGSDTFLGSELMPMTQAVHSNEPSLLSSLVTQQSAYESLTCTPDTAYQEMFLRFLAAQLLKTRHRVFVRVRAFGLVS